MEDIEAVEAFRAEVETPKMGTGFALIRKYLTLVRIEVGIEVGRCKGAVLNPLEAIEHLIFFLSQVMWKYELCSKEFLQSVQ